MFPTRSEVPTSVTKWTFASAPGTPDARHSTDQMEVVETVMSTPSAGLPATASETHVSYVFFTADHAYKLKKPVSMPFLDFSTVQARQAACEREVALNRRLAPDVYEGVATVLDPDGQVCDHLVVMRRLPGDRSLESLIRNSDETLEDELKAIAHLLANFHATTDRSTEVNQASSIESVRGNWEANTVELQPFCDRFLDPTVVARVDDLARRYLAGREELFAERIAADRAVDGHGDLLAGDVFCLDDGPRVLDCLEFSDRLRYCDVLGDVAFLAMDIERLGRPDLAALFLSTYRDATGDDWPDSLAHHWIAYRAQVRAKVACLRWSEIGGPGKEDPRALLSIALAHLESATIRLVLVGGLPGTGKSTLAAGLAQTLGWDVLRSDVVRKELSGMKPTDSAEAPFGSGLYGPEVTSATYAEMLRSARGLLANGHSVVLDATWNSRSLREAAGLIAAEAHAELVELRCAAPLEVAASRIEARSANSADPSDATVEVAAALADESDPWPSAVVIDTAGAPETALDQARRVLASRPRGAG